MLAMRYLRSTALISNKKLLQNKIYCGGIYQLRRINTHFSGISCHQFHVADMRRQVEWSVAQTRCFATQVTTDAEAEEVSDNGNKETNVSPKVAALVEQITLLNLKEVAELVSELKTQLNLPETTYQPTAVPAAAVAPGIIVFVGVLYLNSYS